MAEILASIALGANLGDPVAMIRRACRLLAQTPAIVIARHSSLYRSAPVGPSDQPDYVNAAVLIRVGLEPLSLLDCLQSIESECGRSEKRRHWGEREIDLDIITYGGRVIRSERLTVPHPEAHHRCFVLAPLAEMNPQLKIPGYGDVGELLLNCDTGSADKIEGLNILE